MIVDKILGILEALLKALPIINKWISKSAAEREEDARKEVRDAIEHARKKGRPKWD